MRKYPTTRVSDRLRAAFGEIDIYLFDQLLRGRFDARRRVLDAGCGDGRNLPYFLAHGFDVHAIDADARAVAAADAVARAAGCTSATGRIVRGQLDALPYRDATMDAVICSAVLHFATDQAHFTRMIDEMWRVLAPGGLFFARLASSIGLEPRLTARTGRMRLPDGSARFVVDEPLLLETTTRLGGTLADPIKTTNVQQLRCMTTWVVEK